MKKRLALLAFLGILIVLSACSHKAEDTYSVPSYSGRFSSNSVPEESSKSVVSSSVSPSISSVLSSQDSVIVSTNSELSSSSQSQISSNSITSTIIETSSKLAISEMNPLEALGLACHNFKSSLFVRTTTTGKVKAKALVFDYNQKLGATRVLNENIAFLESVSTSTFVKVGLQRIINNDIFYERDGNPSSLTNVNWDDAFHEINYDDYMSKYGNLPYNLFPYVLDNTIVKSEYVKTENDLAYFYFELEPDEAAIYYRREIKTTGNSGDFPNFSYIDFTIAIDQNGFPVAVVRNENYKIDLLGGVSCKCSLEETIEYGQVPFDFGINPLEINVK